MVSHKQVFKDEEGTYGTIPDGDTPTMEEIIDFEVKNARRL